MKFSTAISLALVAGPAAAFTASSASRRAASALSMGDSPFFSSDIAKALDKEVSCNESHLYLQLRRNEVADDTSCEG